MKNLHPKELLEDVALQLKFKSPAYVEKDSYITYALHILTTIHDDNFKLIFAGGTCLAKAHRIINRMSEDIDLKIISKLPTTTFSTSALRNKLREFREKILSALQKAEFVINENNILNVLH